MTQDGSTANESEVPLEPLGELAETISRWAQERGLQRLRSDRRLGYPDEEHLVLWSRILAQRGVTDSESICTVLDAAVIAAPITPVWDLPDEDPACDWAVTKQKIRNRIREVPFLNWFERTRQVERRGAHITIAVPDEATRFFPEAEYGKLTRDLLGEFAVEEIELTVVFNGSKTFSNMDEEVTAK